MRKRVRRCQICSADFPKCLAGTATHYGQMIFPISMQLYMGSRLFGNRRFSMRCIENNAQKAENQYDRDEKQNATPYAAHDFSPCQQRGSCCDIPPCAIMPCS